MRKFFLLTCVALCAVFTMTGCSESDPSYHTMSITSRLTDSPVVRLFADQVRDTVVVRTTDAWKADTQCDWLLFELTGSRTDEANFDYEYGTEKAYARVLTIVPNTTDAMRFTAVRLRANNHDAFLQYVQLNHLNVIDPVVSYTDASAFKGATFTKKVGAAAQEASITVQLYAAATLSSDQSWLTIAEPSLEAGMNTVALNVEQNTTGAERTANLTLLSTTGAKTVVTVVQGI